MATFSRRISPFFPEFRHFLVSARGKLGLTAASLSITTDGPLFINSGTGNDTIIDNSKTPGDVVIDPGGGTNNIQASSNPTSHDTILVDAEADAPLTDGITGLKAGDMCWSKD
jgi:hypothetical protein